MPRYQWISLLLWLVALTLVGWALSQMPLDAIAQTMQALTWPQWLAWSCVNIAIILLGTERWHVLTRLLGLPVTFLQLLLIRQAGQTVSFITPGPQFGGEPLQIYWLYKRCAIAIHSAVLALGMDRFFELWINFSVLLLGVALLLLSPVQTGADLPQIMMALFGMMAVLTVLGWLALRKPRWVSGRLERLSQRWLQSPRLRQLDDHWQALGSDLQKVFNTRKPGLLWALALSVLGWIVIFAEMALVLAFLDIEVDVAGFVLIMVAMRLALLLPLPGGIGTLEASVLWSFQSLGLPASAAVGVIALMRLRDAMVLLAGLLCLRAVQKV
jgi:uncharacterized protein (TIRG00374 family)